MSLLGFHASTPAGAAGLLVMPYACEARAGRVQLMPAADVTYPILGPHEQQAITACAPASPQLCRTWMAHKFELSCGGTRVAWFAVVKAMVEGRPWSGWVGDGRLNIRMGSRWAGFAPECGLKPPPAASRAGARPRPLAAHCAPSRQREATGVVAMPLGFAPVLGSGARFLSLPQASAARPATMAGPSSTKPVASAETGDNPWVTTLSDTAPRVASVGPSGAAAPPGPPARADVVLAQNLAPIAPAGPLPADMFRIGLIGLAVLGLCLLLAGARGLLGIERGKPGPDSGEVQADGTAAVADDPSPATVVASVANAPDVAAVACAAMLRSTEALHTAVRAQVHRVTAPDLRASLLDQLGQVEQVLTSPQLARQIEAAEWTSLQTVLAVMLGDLEQIQTGLNAVPADDLPPVESWALPGNRLEACALLGVNPDADDRLIKKVVDGLRQSWHPDLSRDERDRRLREHRITHINVAWELISGRRQEAA